MAITDVITLTGVVNILSDNECCHGHSTSVKTIRDRIEWIQVKLGTAEEPISIRELARRAGVSEPTISMLFGRLKKDPNASMTAKTAIGIALAGGVTERWLTKGEGPRDTSTPSPYATLERLFVDRPDDFTGGDHQALRALRFKADEEPDERKWYALRDELRTKRKGKTADKGPADDDEESPGKRLRAAEARGKAKKRR